MKHMKYIFIIFISFLVFNIHAYAASSKFEPLLSFETEIIDNQVFVIIGYEGEEVLALTQEIAYETKYLELDSITAIGGFDITTSDVHDEGTYSTVKILADSNKVYKEVKFAILTFNITKRFKKNKIATVFLYNYDSIGPNKEKYRHKGYELSIKRDANNEVMFLKTAIDDSTKSKIWFREHYMIFIFIIIGIIGVICFIFIIPSSRKKENRGADIKKNIDAPKKKSSIVPIKLDQDMISMLGEEEKEVDMSEAIEVTDLKPFGDAVGKYEEGALGQDAKMVDMDVFEMKSPGVEEKLESLESDDDMEMLDINDEDDEELEVLDVQDKLEKLETLDVQDKLDKLGIFILLLLTSTILIGTVNATEYNVSKLKNHIVNDLKYDKTLDYNDDGKIDLADLLETKDMSAIEYDEEKIDLPVYEPID